MDKPHSFAGKIIRKFGKQNTNDYTQPDKFFADMQDCLHLLDGIPFSAVEDLQKYELNRDVMINIIRRIYDICFAAKIDIDKEMDRMEKSPFDGLEEDIKKQATIKISAEENE